MPKPLRRRGLSAVEVIVVVVIVSLVGLTLLMTLPRRLEVARRAACQRNLMQIGVALVLYDQETGHLPVVPELGRPAESRGSGPLKALLETLGLPDLRGLSDLDHRPERRPGLAIEERRVPGFICPSDPNATAGRFPAPVSYRATTGDTPDGRTGAFAPGRRTRLADIESGDGLGYTAAFSERLVGENRPAPAPFNYAETPGPLPATGCPPLPPSAWRGDAGSSWAACDWRSTLYNHALTPNAAPSCLSDDGRSAFMGASSGHPGTVHVLTFDGSVKAFTPSINPQIWRDLATVKAPR